MSHPRTFDKERGFLRGMSRPPGLGSAALYLPDSKVHTKPLRIRPSSPMNCSPPAAEARGACTCTRTSAPGHLPDFPAVGGARRWSLYSFHLVVALSPLPCLTCDPPSTVGPLTPEQRLLCRSLAQRRPSARLPPCLCG